MKGFSHCICVYLKLPEVLEQSLPGPSGARPNSPTVRGAKIANLALGGPGAADKDRLKEKEKSKEVREREKVEKRLTEVREDLVYTQ